MDKNRKAKNESSLAGVKNLSQIRVTNQKRPRPAKLDIASSQEDGGVLFIQSDEKPADFNKPASNLEQRID